MVNVRNVILFNILRKSQFLIIHEDDYRLWTMKKIYYDSQLMMKTPQILSIWLIFWCIWMIH